MRLQEVFVIQEANVSIRGGHGVSDWEFEFEILVDGKPRGRSFLITYDGDGEGLEWGSADGPWIDEVDEADTKKIYAMAAEDARKKNWPSKEYYSDPWGNDS